MRRHATSSEVFTEVKHWTPFQFVSHLQFGAYSFDIVVDLVFTLVAEPPRAAKTVSSDHTVLCTPWVGGELS